MKSLTGYVVFIVAASGVAVTSDNPAENIELLIACMTGAAISGIWSLLISKKKKEDAYDRTLHAMLALVSGMSFGYWGAIAASKSEIGFISTFGAYKPMAGIILSISGYALAVLFLNGFLAKVVEKFTNKKLGDTGETGNHEIIKPEE